MALNFSHFIHPDKTTVAHLEVISVSAVYIHR